MGLAGSLGDQVGPVPLLNIQGGGYVVAALFALAALGSGARWARPGVPTASALEASAPMAGQSDMNVSSGA
jgi:hypothetical protein